MGKMHGTEGSQVAGLSVQEVMDVVERDTHMADQPKNREEKPQECRGMGAAIKGGKYKVQVNGDVPHWRRWQNCNQRR